MFSSLFVCLFVSNFAQKLPSQETFREGWQWADEQMIKFWWRSGSGIHITTLVRRALAEVCTVPVLLVDFVLAKMYFYHTSTYLVHEWTQLLDHTFVATSHSLGCHDQDEYDWRHCQCAAVRNKFLGWHNIDHFQQCQQCSVNVAHYHVRASPNTINILFLICQITETT